MSSLRHSTEERPRQHPHLTPYQQEKECAREISEQEAERLASKIVDVASDYEAQKAEDRFGPLSDRDFESGAAMEPSAVANKLIKEAARETMRAEGKHNAGMTFKGGEAAKLERVRMAKDDPQAPEHKVYMKVKEKIEAAEEHILHPHEFAGPNPERGQEGLEKRRHMKTTGAHITGREKHEHDSIIERGA